MDTIKYSKEIPDIYYVCKDKFGVNWDDNIIFTYGDTIYCKTDIPEDLKVHEATHIRQQKSGAKEWWDRYLNDNAFRLDQEVEAYKNQYNYLKIVIKDRNKLFLHKHRIAKDLSSYIYGNIISYSDALALL